MQQYVQLLHHFTSIGKVNTMNFSENTDSWQHCIYMYIHAYMYIHVYGNESSELIRKQQKHHTNTQ